MIVHMTFNGVTAHLDTSSFHGWGPYSFQDILIRCTFIFEDVPQNPFVDFLDFSSVSF